MQDMNMLPAPGILVTQQTHSNSSEQKGEFTNAKEDLTKRLPTSGEVLETT